MTTSDRMVKWSIELSEYSLEFRPRQSIKVQALADFVAKCSFYNLHNTNQGEQSIARSNSCHITPEPNESNLWLVYVDGSSTQEGA